MSECTFISIPLKHINFFSSLLASALHQLPYSLPATINQALHARNSKLLTLSGSDWLKGEHTTQVPKSIGTKCCIESIAVVGGASLLGAIQDAIGRDFSDLTEGISEERKKAYIGWSLSKEFVFKIVSNEIVAYFECLWYKDASHPPTGNGIMHLASRALDKLWDGEFAQAFSVPHAAARFTSGTGYNVFMQFVKKVSPAVLEPGFDSVGRGLKKVMDKYSDYKLGGDVPDYGGVVMDTTVDALSYYLILKQVMKSPKIISICTPTKLTDKSELSDNDDLDHSLNKKEFPCEMPSKILDAQMFE